MENQIKIKCVICAFSDEQDDIIETKDGYAHQECLSDQMTKYGELSDEDEDNLCGKAHNNGRDESECAECMTIS